MINPEGIQDPQTLYLDGQEIVLKGTNERQNEQKTPINTEDLGNRISALLN